MNIYEAINAREPGWRDSACCNPRRSSWSRWGWVANHLVNTASIHWCFARYWPYLKYWRCCRAAQQRDCSFVCARTDDIILSVIRGKRRHFIRGPAGGMIYVSTMLLVISERTGFVRSIRWQNKFVLAADVVQMADLYEARNRNRCKGRFTSLR